MSLPSLPVSRRKRWLLAAAAGLAAATALLFGTGGNLKVVLYNNTDRPFRNIAVSVGNQHSERPVLEAQESAEVSFRPTETSSDVRLSIDADPPLRWSAPSLANPSLSRITLRVDNSGAVTLTLEKSWSAQLSGWME